MGKTIKEEERFQELEKKRCNKWISFQEWKERKQLYFIIHKDVNKKEQN